MANLTALEAGLVASTTTTIAGLERLGTVSLAVAARQSVRFSQLCEEMNTPFKAAVEAGSSASTTAVVVAGAGSSPTTVTGIRSS